MNGRYEAFRQLLQVISELNMLAQIPRTPTFPEHMIIKEMKRIEKDVEDDVIPVSAGIYSEHKLMERLQAIPKPDIANYEDPIFFETIDIAKFPCKTAACQLCGQEYGTKKNIALQCHFCGVWSCQSCMCPRKRYHPRAKENNSQRFTICYKCDDKFLSLTLNHRFVQSRALLEEVMKRARKQKDELEMQCDKRQTDSNYARDKANKNKFKISSIKKEQIDFKKTISKLESQRQEETMRLRVRQKYLAILLKKKENFKQRNEQRSSLQQASSIESAVPIKPVRSLSHTNVFSQSIKIETGEIGLEQEKESAKDTNYSRTEESTYSPPLEKTQELKKAEKVNNFYNYHQWGTQQKGVVVQLDEESPEISDKEETHIKTPEKESEAEAEHRSETAQQKIAKIAQIFSRPEPVTQQQDEYSSEDEAESLDGEVIKIRKAALMRAAIEQSHKSRIETMETEMFESDPKKCSCQIY